MREVHIPLSWLPKVMIQVLWEVLWKSLYKGLIESLSLSAYKYKWRKLNAKFMPWCEYRWITYCVVCTDSYPVVFSSILLLPRSVPFCFSLKCNACWFLKQWETWHGRNRDRNKIWVRSVMKVCFRILQFHCRVWRGHDLIIWRRLDNVWDASCVNRLVTRQKCFSQAHDLKAFIHCQNA